MSKGSTKVDAPDPIEIARADARFNRIDQYTPFANFTYSGPDRNQATLQLNPFLAGNENRRMLSDRMMLDQALGRQQSMIDGGLPALTQRVDPGALNQFFGLPSSLQGGYDTYNNIPNVPDITGQAGTGGGSKGGSKGGSQGGGLPSAPPGGPVIPGQGGMKGNTIGTAQGLQQAATPGGGQSGGPMGVYNHPGFQQAQQQQPQQQVPQAKGGGQMGGQQPYRPGADMSISPKIQPQPTSAWGQPPPQAMESQAPAKGGQQQSSSPFGGSIGEYIDPSRISGDRVEKALYDRQLNLIQPELDQQEQRTVTDLRARGIPRGSEAWNNEIARLDKNRMLQYGNLANQSVLAGGQEQSRQQGIQQGIFGMADMLSQRDIQAQLQNANIASSNRATQFNELASLLGLQQVASPQLNNFFAPGQADVTGAYALNQQAQAGNAQRSADMKGGVMEGLTSLGGAAMTSDRRLKENIKRIGSINGYPLYEFDYVWGEHSIGVMSDEVPEDFVIKHPSGYDMVDYSKVLQWQA